MEAQPAQGSTLNSQSGATKNQPTKGVPFIVHLKYVNGSIPATGKLNYTIRFSFNEPFKVSEVNKGTFNKAVVLNKTAVQFQSSSISKFQNKTGLVLFSFQNGLAEKHRIINLTHNVTLSISYRVNYSGFGSYTPPVLTASRSLQTGPLSASIVDYVLGIIDIGTNVTRHLFELGQEVYSKTTPCVSISGDYVGNSTYNNGFLVHY